MAQAVNFRPVTAGDGVWSWVVPCEICGGQGGTVRGFVLRTLVLPFQYQHTNPTYSFSFKFYWLETNKQVKQGKLKKIQYTSGLEGNWRGNAFTLSVFKRLRKIRRLCCPVIESNKIYHDYSLFQNGYYLAACRTKLGQEWRPEHTAEPLWSQ
jgi:hypothetical protein